VALVTEAGGPHLPFYLEALALAPEIGSVALCDPSGETESLAQSALGDKLAACHTELATLLRSEQPQLSLVTMEAAKSPPVIDELLNAGSHVLAEKPSCVRIEDFEKLHHKAKARNLHLVLALANRVDPVLREAQRLVRSGSIGTVYGVEVHIVADQTRLTRPEYKNSWFAQKQRAGGGHLIWLGIHWLDMAMWVTGSPLRSVTGFTANVGGSPVDIEDSAVVAMQFENGTLGTLTSGYYLDPGFETHLKVWGSHGWLLVEKHAETPLQWYSMLDPDPRIQRYQQPEGHPDNLYLPFVRSVAAACAGQGEIPLSTDQSLEVLQAVFATYRAAETGRTQHLG
jgi:predicted dehydrogenase